MAKEVVEVTSKKLAFFNNLSAEQPKTYLKQHTKLTKLSDELYYLPLFADKPYARVSSMSHGVGYVLAEAVSPVVNKHIRSTSGGIPNASS